MRLASGGALGGALLGTRQLVCTREPDEEAPWASELAWVEGAMVSGTFSPNRKPSGMDQSCTLIKQRV